MPFAFGEQPVRVHVNKEGETWFAAPDVARVLGYRDASNMTRMLDDDEKGTHNVSTLGGKQRVSTISESGLYHAVIKSQKDTAKPFRRWVTHEVLPALRKTGRYEVAGAASVPALPGVPAALRPRAKVLYRDRVAAVVALRAELEAEAGHAVSLRQIARTLAERGSAVDVPSVMRYIYAADLIDLLPRAFGAGGSDHLVRVIRQVERRIEALLTTHRRADQLDDEVHVWRTHLADHDAPRIGPRLARAALTGYAPSLARRLRQPADRIEAALSA